MKYLVLVLTCISQIMFAKLALADTSPTDNSTIPTIEKDFVGAINGFDKAKIVAQFGEPAKADDVKIKGSDKIVASIWQYHFINTTADGTYYETTELDFVDDKVVTVVFINNDGTEVDNNSEKFEIPAAKPYS